MSNKREAVIGLIEAGKTAYEVDRLQISNHSC
jgi:hypothetical protein